ncbi:MAG: hypothetical protein QXO70_05025 [Candidatus Pacearchaeota archaeon]
MEQPTSAESAKTHPYRIIGQVCYRERVNEILMSPLEDVPAKFRHKIITFIIKKITFYSNPNIFFYIEEPIREEDNIKLLEMGAAHRSAPIKSWGELFEEYLQKKREFDNLPLKNKKKLEKIEEKVYQAVAIMMLYLIRRD